MLKTIVPVEGDERGLELIIHLATATSLDPSLRHATLSASMKEGETITKKTSICDAWHYGPGVITSST